MRTLFDFVTQVKGVEYLISVSAIGLFLVLWETLKDRPFRVVAEAKADLPHFRLRSVGRALAAPWIGLAYLIALPFVFLVGLSSALLEVLGKLLGYVRLPELVFGWRPQLAYLFRKKPK